MAGEIVVAQYGGPIVAVETVRGAARDMLATARAARDGLILRIEDAVPPKERTAAEALADDKAKARTLRTAVQAAMKAARDVFRPIVDAIGEEEKAFLAPLIKAEEQAEAKLAVYRTEERARMLAEEERRRRRAEEEAAALAALRKAQEEELRKVADEDERRRAEMRQADELREAERIAAREVGTAPKVEALPGVRVGRKPDWKVVDPDAVDRRYCSPDPALIRAKVQQLWSQMKQDEPRFIEACKQALVGVTVTVTDSVR